MESIQSALTTQGFDGWLFYDFRGSDPLGRTILGLQGQPIGTRRWFYFVPAAGTPIKIVHAIEQSALDLLPGEKRIYLPWTQLHELLAEILRPLRRVVMQYSPENAIPYISRVDAGTVELVRSFGVEVVSSADLVQQFEATLTDEQFDSQQYAAAELGKLVEAAFAEIADRLRADKPTTEFDIQQFLERGFDQADLVTDHPPIVAVGPNSANPHYAPTAGLHDPITPDSFVLIDIWAKRRQPASIYGDITWTGFVGGDVPQRYVEVFNIVRAARDAAIDAVRQAQSEHRPIRGCEVDDVCRRVIVDAGFGDKFIHRTGHSIHEVGHGNGANIDNLETRDSRLLIPRTCFSIEPGIYLEGEFGVRSEVDLFLPDCDTVVVTGPPPQQEIVRILV